MSVQACRWLDCKLPPLWWDVTALPLAYEILSDALDLKKKTKLKILKNTSTLWQCGGAVGSVFVSCLQGLQIQIGA